MRSFGALAFAGASLLGLSACSSDGVQASTGDGVPLSTSAGTPSTTSATSGSTGGASAVTTSSGTPTSGATSSGSTSTSAQASDTGSDTTGSSTSGSTTGETSGTDAAGGSTGAGGASGTTEGTGATGGTSATEGTSTTEGTTGGGGGFDAPFILGADISSVQESNATFVDTDGQTKSIFELLKNHGFNYIRLKTFVDPMAPYGYASSENGCSGLSEAFGDRDHVVEYGSQAKAAGMGFLLDFHYSDVWADPGNQIIPDAWRGAASIEELADYVRDYTVDVISTAVAQGARPDMVQVGNEITPGMLAHVPGSSTDCWGNNPSGASVGGSTSNWDNLAALLSAGIEAVHQVDPEIKIMLHIENTDDPDGVAWWVDNALSHGVEFDVLGLSCYVAFQGQPNVWQSTFTAMAEAHPELEFVIAEYNPERTQANLIMKNLPDGRGLGTFFWEPTRSGEWGEAMFTWNGSTATANASDFAEYDELLPELGL